MIRRAIFKRLSESFLNQLFLGYHSRNRLYAIFRARFEEQSVIQKERQEPRLPLTIPENSNKNHMLLIIPKLEYRVIIRGL